MVPRLVMDPPAAPNKTKLLGNNTRWLKESSPLLVQEAEVIELTGFPVLPFPFNHIFPLFVNRRPTKLYVGAKMDRDESKDILPLLVIDLTTPSNCTVKPTKVLLLLMNNSPST